MKPRRWFRFSLRTMLVLVTLAGCAAWWVQVQLKWIHDRHDALRVHSVGDIGAWMSLSDTAPPPWSIRVLGEKGIPQLHVNPSTPSDETERQHEIKRLEKLFPEAKIIP